MQARRQQADWRAVRRGTVQHEILEGERAAVFIDGDKIQKSPDALGPHIKLSETQYPVSIQPPIGVVLHITPLSPYNIIYAHYLLYLFRLDFPLPKSNSC